QKEEEGSDGAVREPTAINLWSLSLLVRPSFFFPFFFLVLPTATHRRCLSKANSHYKHRLSLLRTRHSVASPNPHPPLSQNYHPPPLISGRG
ncbi:hypothetical protein HN873_038892, partial [Arachis hypogaea]